MTTDSEIKIDSNGVHLKGEIVNDIRKPIKRLSSTTDAVLRLIDNIVGLPADFISSHLEVFREKYRENVERIPEDKRVEPSFRLGCSVLKNVAYSVEEPQLQKLFANLLASASNKDIADTVHPGFATVINELTSDDARLLSDINGSGHFIKTLNFAENSRSISNLIRLGLLKWNAKAYDANELNKFVGNSHYNAPSSQNDLYKITVTLINDVQKLKNNLVKDRQYSHRREELSLSEFGRDFINTVIKSDG
ncbi:hypothetical protein Rhein_3078 [Rheinheimera sp. A13L]|uniref:Abi-alpha family protein n=1 Tax=Rheinheimera sp. A13L TaxID=506534 RepID=UPI0002125502|nr:Abi-alpha family protein [Rheinheimera sp. A13L]EGM76841.1 hypothetical protein Rhein_3078 [Rheinheimera sp. A13L]